MRKFLSVAIIIMCMYVTAKYPGSVIGSVEFGFTMARQSLTLLQQNVN